jgi:hypothetical protein
MLGLVGNASAKLIAYYKFEGNAKDSVGGNNGSEFGGPTYVSGAFGQAINLDGVDDYVDCGNSPVFDITSAITVACWVRIDSVPANWAGIVTKGDSAWRLSTAWGERRFHFSVTSVNVNGNTTIPAGEWHHICGTFDGSVIRIYVDGVEDNKADYAGSISTNGFNVWIGANSETSGRWWDGRIDDVRIYDQALSAEVVASLTKAMKTAFTYQGRLMDANNPADGLYDFQFKLYDNLSGGVQKGLAIEVNEVDVIDGYFTAEIDFGSDVFDGTDCWLEIGVRVGELNDPNVYTILSPRQQVTPTPYSLYAVTAASLKEGVSWSEVTNRPAGLDDGDDVGLTSESDPQVGSNSTNYIPKWNGSALVSGTMYDNGNVGIGTASPADKLDVNGFINSNESYKLDGGTVLADSGTDNIFVGKGAGASNTTGWANSAVGTNAFYSNTGGCGNTAVGKEALFYATGFSNSAVGHWALWSNTTGNYNTAVGMSALISNTTSNNNTAVGFQAGFNSTGSGNVFLGFRAGYNETGSNKLYIANSDVNNLIYGDFSTGTVAVKGAIKWGTSRGFLTTDQGASIELGGSGTPYIDFINDGATDYDVRISLPGDDALAIEGGNLGIGTTAPTERLDTDGTARLRGIGSSSGTTVVADGNGKLWKQSSSRRYKTNIESLDEDTDAVLKLRPVRFQWKATGQNDIGLVAEEVEQQLNDLVIYDNEGRPEAVKYDRVSLYLLAVVKDLKAENESLKQRIEALEAKMQEVSTFTYEK